MFLGVEMYMDGSFYPDRPGRPAYAAFVAVQDGQVIRRWSNKVIARNPTEAEFWAVIKALEWACHNGCCCVDVHSDCRALLEALKLRRRWSERFVARIMELAAPLDSVNFQQVSRKEVREADWMCRVRARADEEAGP